MTTITKKTMLLANNAPTLTRVSSTPGGTDGELSVTMSVYLAGANLANPTEVAVDYKSITGVPSTRTLTSEEYEAEAAQILIPMTLWNEFSFDHNEPLTFKVSNADGTASRNATAS